MYIISYLYNSKIIFYSTIVGISYYIYHLCNPVVNDNDFSNFVKVKPKATDSKSINAFLKQPYEAPYQPTPNEHSNRENHVFNNIDKVRVAVLFGTEFGFSQEIAEYVA